MRNKFEKAVAKQLKKAKVRYEYESERFDYVIYGRYLPDFVLSSNEGRKTYIECKGYFRPEDKRKLRAVKKAHPELDIRILFYSRNTQYIRWAEKHGFPWAIETIPEDWLP